MNIDPQRRGAVDQAALGKCVQIDFGVADVVVPNSVGIEFPLMLGGEPIRRTAYPVETTIAEKIHVMVGRHLRNSSLKGFSDICVLFRNRSGPRRLPSHPERLMRTSGIDAKAMVERIRNEL